MRRSEVDPRGDTCTCAERDVYAIRVHKAGLVRIPCAYMWVAGGYDYLEYLRDMRLARRYTLLVV